MAGDKLALRFVTLDVFTETRFEGNPLAVVFVPAALRERVDQATKQRIAREFNLSETVFLHTFDDEPNTGATTRQMDIFTPEEELPFAGHPTIGTAALVLHRLGWGHVDTLLTKAGPIRIEPLAAGQPPRRGVRAAIPHAVHVHQQTLGSVLALASTADAVREAIERGLSSDPEIRAAELAAPAVSIVRGMTFLLVRLPSLEHLARAGGRLDFALVGDSLLDEGEWRGGFVARYHYVPVAESLEADGRRRFAVQARMAELAFEDPATGSAACALASYLAMRGEADRGARFEIVQGVEMGRRSEIVVDVAARMEPSGEMRVREIFLGGTAVEVMSGEVSV